MYRPLTEGPFNLLAGTARGRLELAEALNVYASLNGGIPPDSLDLFTRDATFAVDEILDSFGVRR